MPIDGLARYPFSISVPRHYTGRNIVASLFIGPFTQNNAYIYIYIFLYIVYILYIYIRFEVFLTTYFCDLLVFCRSLSDDLYLTSRSVFIINR